MSLPHVRMPLRAIVCDIGDVLFLRHPPAAFVARWASQLGLTADRLQALLWYGPDIEAANIGAITAEEYGRRCAARLGTEAALVHVLLEEAFSGERLNEDLVMYLRTLRPRLSVVALTNTWSFGRTLIERRGLTGLFDLIVSAAEEGVKKPQPRIYEVMLARLECLSGEVVFVDDHAENVAAARALGIPSIQFGSTAQTIAAVEALLVRHRG